MNKIKTNAANVQELAAQREKKKVTIDLMPYFTVRIARLLDTYGKTTSEHYLTVPIELLADVTELTCTLNYPIEEPHTFKIPLRKHSFRGTTFINTVTLFLAVAKEYEVLSKTKGFIDSTLSDLWIESMKIEGDKLIVGIKSLN